MRCAPLLRNYGHATGVARVNCGICLDLRAQAIGGGGKAIGHLAMFPVGVLSRPLRGDPPKTNSHKILQNPSTQANFCIELCLFPSSQVNPPPLPGIWIKHCFHGLYRQCVLLKLLVYIMTLIESSRAIWSFVNEMTDCLYCSSEQAPFDRKCRNWKPYLQKHPQYRVTRRDSFSGFFSRHSSLPEIYLHSGRYSRLRVCGGEISGQDK